MVDNNKLLTVKLLQSPGATYRAGDEVYFMGAVVLIVPDSGGRARVMGRDSV